MVGVLASACIAAGSAKVADSRCRNRENDVACSRTGCPGCEVASAGRSRTTLAGCHSLRQPAQRSVSWRTYLDASACFIIDRRVVYDPPRHMVCKRPMTPPRPQSPGRQESAMPSLLVIDDDSAVLSVFRRVFDQTDAILHTASSANEGMQMLARHQVDAVLLDVMLPDSEGLD